jgi:hypothetical protein
MPMWHTVPVAHCRELVNQKPITPLGDQTPPNSVPFIPKSLASTRRGQHGDLKAQPAKSMTIYIATPTCIKQHCASNCSKMTRHGTSVRSKTSWCQAQQHNPVVLPTDAAWKMKDLGCSPHRAEMSLLSTADTAAAARAATLTPSIETPSLYDVDKRNETHMTTHQHRS